MNMNHLPPDERRRRQEVNDINQGIHRARDQANAWATTLKRDGRLECEHPGSARSTKNEIELRHPSLRISVDGAALHLDGFICQCCDGEVEASETDARVAGWHEEPYRDEIHWFCPDCDA